MLKRLRSYLRSQSSKTIISSLLVSVEALSYQGGSPTKEEFCSRDQDGSAITLTEDNFETNIAKCLEGKKSILANDNNIFREILFDTFYSLKMIKI